MGGGGGVNRSGRPQPCPVIIYAAANPVLDIRGLLVNRKISEETSSTKLQQTKRFSEGLDAFRFFFEDKNDKKEGQIKQKKQVSIVPQKDRYDVEMRRDCMVILMYGHTHIIARV